MCSTEHVPLHNMLLYNPEADNKNPCCNPRCCQQSKNDKQPKFLPIYLRPNNCLQSNVHIPHRSSNNPELYTYNLLHFLPYRVCPPFNLFSVTSTIKAKIKIFIKYRFPYFRKFHNFFHNNISINCHTFLFNNPLTLSNFCSKLILSKERMFVVFW